MLELKRLSLFYVLKLKLCLKIKTKKSYNELKRKGKTQRICWPKGKVTSLQQETRTKAGSQKHTNIPISNILCSDVVRCCN